MTNEEIMNLWGQQAEDVAVSPEEIWQLAQASERFERTIFWRDIREWAATVVVAGCFLYFAFSEGTTRWLILAAAVVCCGPMAYLTLRRPKRLRPETAGSVLEHLRAAVASLQHQIGLLRSVHWWYLMPIALAISFVFIDRRQWERGFVATLLVSGFGIGLFLGIWMLNQRCVRQDLEPRLRELERTLSQLEV